MASGDQKDWSRSRHEVRGSGSASRIRLNTGLLEEAGWKILSRESGNGVHLRTVPTNSKIFLPRFMIMQEMYILTSVSINTQVIIQNHALSLARYLGLSADNHLDGQNGCQ